MRLLALLVVIAPTLARAQDAAPPPPPPPAPPPPTTLNPAPPTPLEGTPVHRFWLGGGLELLSLGNLTVDLGAGTGTAMYDMDTGFALEGMLDYQLTSLVTLRFMPRWMFNLKTSGNPESFSAWDLRAGATVGMDFAPRIRGYGLAAIGYSSYSPPASAMSSDNANGPDVTFGGGVAYKLNPTARGYVEAAYELGFQELSSKEFRFKFLEVAAGVQILLGH